MHHRGQAARGAASEERVRGEMAPKVRVGPAERAGQEEPFLVPRGRVRAGRLRRSTSRNAGGFRQACGSAWVLVVKS